MDLHALAGDFIKSKKESRIWISVDEIFRVERVVISQLTGKKGVLFIDRHGGERVFWNVDDYEVLFNVHDHAISGKID